MMDELEIIRREKMRKFLEKKAHGETKIEVDDSNFEEKVIDQSKEIPVVVDFWATWCMPCLMLSPALEKLAKEYNGKFILAKMNVDSGQSTSKRYGVMSIPSVKMFKDGKVIDEFVGALPEGAVKEWLDRAIKKSF